MFKLDGGGIVAFFKSRVNMDFETRCGCLAKIKIALVGVGNCASALVQGLQYYGTRSGADCMGLRNPVVVALVLRISKLWRHSMLTLERWARMFLKLFLPNPTMFQN